MLREPLGSKSDCLDPLTVFRTPQPIEVPALAMHGGIWTVLLPGFGKAWVNDVDVCFVHWTKVANRPFTSLRHLSISMTSSSLDFTGLLLSHIGQTIASLRVLYYDGGRRIDQWLRTVISNCRYLEELVFSGITRGNLLGSHRSLNSMSCKLKKLAFPVSCSPGVNMLHLESFVRDLNLEPPSGLAVHLEELHVTLVIELTTQLDVLYDVLLDLLLHNSRLVEISYSFRIDHPLRGSVLKQTIEHMFGKYTQDEPTLCTTRFMRSQKLAILSVVRMSYLELSTTQFKALGQMSSDIIPRVFSYAGDRIVRRFDLRFCQ